MIELILRKIIKIVAIRCQILRLNAPNSISAGALPQTPLGELTALPQTLRGLLLREGERRGKGMGGMEGDEHFDPRALPPPVEAWCPPPADLELATGLGPHACTKRSLYTHLNAKITVHDGGPYTTRSVCHTLSDHASE